MDEQNHVSGAEQETLLQPAEYQKNDAERII